MVGFFVRYERYTAESLFPGVSCLIKSWRGMLSLTPGKAVLI